MMPVQGSSHRDRNTGPLTPAQRRILAALAHGHRHQEIAKVLGITAQHSMNQMSSAVGKMGARTSAEAVARWAEAIALDDAADYVFSQRVSGRGTPLSEAEEHLNWALDEIAGHLRSRSALRLPS